MTWINAVAYEDSDGELRQLYDRVKGPDNNIDNTMLAHSLRPHTMQGWKTAKYSRSIRLHRILLMPIALCWASGLTPRAISSGCHRAMPATRKTGLTRSAGIPADTCARVYRLTRLLAFACL